MPCFCSPYRERIFHPPLLVTKWPVFSLHSLFRFSCWKQDWRSPDSHRQRNTVCAWWKNGMPRLFAVVGTPAFDAAIFWFQGDEYFAWPCRPLYASRSKYLFELFLQLWLPFLNFFLFLTLSLVFFLFQSTRTLELALSLEAKVIHLKQDSLCLFNLALAGCACGALVDLFEAAYGYPKTEEQKERARSLNNSNINSLMRKKKFRFLRWRKIKRTRGRYSPTLSRASHLLLSLNPPNFHTNPRPKLPNALLLSRWILIPRGSRQQRRATFPGWLILTMWSW